MLYVLFMTQVFVILAGLHPHLSDSKVRFAPPREELPPPPSTQTAKKKTSNVSFEEYHATWTGIATSKSDENQENPCRFSMIFYVYLFIGSGILFLWLDIG